MSAVCLTCVVDGNKDFLMSRLLSSTEVPMKVVSSSAGWQTCSECSFVFAQAHLPNSTTVFNSLNAKWPHRCVSWAALSLETVGRCEQMMADDLYQTRTDFLSSSVSRRVADAKPLLRHPLSYFAPAVWSSGGLYLDRHRSHHQSYFSNPYAVQGVCIRSKENMWQNDPILFFKAMVRCFPLGTFSKVS